MPIPHRLERLLAPLLILALAAAALFYWQPWRSDAPKPQYRLGEAEEGRLSAAVSASGTLAARVTVQVGSQVSGQIAQLLADFNSPVKKGQIIARLDPAAFESRVAQARAELASARSAERAARHLLEVRQAELERARIALDEAARNLERKRALVREQFLSPAELDSAQAAHDSAREQLRLAEANLRAGADQLEAARAQVVQRAAALRQAEVELAHTVIRSPVDGVVISRNVDVGQTVAASLQAPVLFTIAQDLRRMEVNIAVDEADVGRVKPGQKVRFTVDAYPGERFNGRVSEIRKAAQTVNNVVTYSVMVSADNPDGKLLPGMTANARILTDERERVLKVPNEALRFRPLNPDGSPVKLEVRAREEGPGIPGRVWVLAPDGQPRPVSLRLGVSDGKATEVLAGDLRAGTQVILGYVEGTEPRPKRQARPFGSGL
ncbi:MAG: efflux RND transporter periplasmic adaptor subunit [Thiobacillaceae bacterium]|nr:efflux RND transporter periplasmic adaptor subunit [Thiobacillaceae bacterium]